MCLVTEPLRGKGHRGTVIAARGGNDARLGALPHQHIGEGAARLERPRGLQEFELEGDRRAREPKILGRNLDHRRPPYVRSDHIVGSEHRRAVRGCR
jgi:hypothetical protein